jgi:hypothetical protein
MTRKEFKKSVWESVVQIMRKQGISLNMVEVNDSLPTISVSSVFFAQGEDAQELIDGIPDDINPRVWILFYLNSAGIFNLAK